MAAGLDVMIAQRKEVLEEQGRETLVAWWWPNVRQCGDLDIDRQRHGLACYLDLRQVGHASLATVCAISSVKQL
jgi:hypothetical protein